MKTETKNKKFERSYFSKCTNTTNEKTFLLNSLLNIVKKIKNDNLDIEEIQKNTSYNMIPVLFSTQTNFMTHINNESKLSIIKIKKMLL